MIKLSLYAQGLKCLRSSKDKKLTGSAYLFVLVLIVSGCAAPVPVPSPSGYPAFEVVHVYDSSQDPWLLELQRENLILSAELRHQQQIINVLQQSVATNNSPAIEPAEPGKLQATAVLNTDSLLLGLGRLWPLAIFGALRTARGLMRR